MKFTNKTIAWLISIVGLITLHYFGYLEYLSEERTESPCLVFSICIDIILLIFLLTGLFTNNIEFEVKIPNPFKYQSKRKLKQQQINSLLSQMVNADAEELDLLIKKKEILENS